MSASTLVEHRQRRLSAGGRSPDWWSSAARPSVFSATVLPPVFGPLIDERAQARRGRGRSARPSPGRAAGGARRAAAPRRRPRPPRRASAARAPPRASARSSAPVASTSARARPPRSPTAPTARAGSARPPRARRSPPPTGGCSARRRRTARRTASAPSSDASWTMPGTLRRALAFTASTGRPPRSVTKSSCRCSRSSLERASCRAPRVTRCRPFRSSVRSLRSCGEALSRRSEPSSSTRARSPRRAARATGRSRPPSSRRSGASSPARRAPAARASAPATRVATCRSVAGGERRRRAPRARRLADVARPRRAAARRRRRAARSPRPSAPAAAPPRRVGRRVERGGEFRAVRGLGGAREALDDRRKLEHRRARAVHLSSVGSAAMDVMVFVEIPAGSRNKYEYDSELGGHRPRPAGSSPR